VYGAGPYGPAAAYGGGAGRYDTTAYGAPPAPGAAGPGGYPGYPYPPGAGYGPGWQPLGYGPNNGLGVAAMALGIIGTVASAVIVGFFLGIILGTLAIIFGAIGRGKAARGEATNGGQALAGLILGAVALIGGVVILVLIGIEEAPDQSEDSGSAFYNVSSAARAVPPEAPPAIAAANR
jgi:hypothetical protein